MTETQSVEYISSAINRPRGGQLFQNLPNQLDKNKNYFFKIKDDYVAIDGVPRIFFYDVVANSERNVFSTDQ